MQPLWANNVQEKRQPKETKQRVNAIREFIPVETKKELHNKIGVWVCEECKSVKLLQIHHKKPLSKRGKNNVENLQLLCQKCHIIKHNKW